MAALRPAFYTDELFVGQNAALSKTITETDIILFSAVSMDTNAIHLDEEYAKTTRFGTNRLPGPGTIFLSQSMKFLAPVHPGETITATVTVTEIIKEKNRVRLETVCSVNDKRVLEGEAVVLSVARPQK
jgi:3-hydroxybutyryl-CoA dehydratase